MSKYTVTWYCSKTGLGCINNRLKPGDVAMLEYRPQRIKKGRARFSYVRFQGKTYRVADYCPTPGRIDIYQGVRQHCTCSQDSDLPGVNKQNGGYPLEYLGSKEEAYEVIDD